ncbi:MAG TPA: hypothetical protein P5205_01860 [Candidatus Paceibacterota bacterium]|nr:hypothetical protein [Verrucomicrobiota bacterium]HSA09091.1 hypothetical protein [Candidatus Paceibacterota bacterium]
MKQNTHIRPVKHKAIRALAMTIATACGAWPVSAATFDDIQFWAGSGANRAALVIDWNDGKSAESLLWGYRWDGTATGLDMLLGVVSADSRLFAHLGEFVWGTSVLGLGYDLNQSGGFGVAPALMFDRGGLATDSDPDDSRVASDAADHWIEGWNNGFWAYYLKATTAEAWASSMVGAGERILADGVWDGYSFAPGFAGTEPGEPLAATVPEPATLTLFLLSGVLLVCARRDRA